MQKSRSEANLQRENSASGSLWRSLGLSVHTLSRSSSKALDGSRHGSRHGSQDGSVRRYTLMCGVGDAVGLVRLRLASRQSVWELG